MTLYLIRHAEALAIGDGVFRDADRPLSARGEYDAALMGRLLSMVDPSPRVIATSPFVRARRTAEALAAQFPAPPRVETWPILAPGFVRRDVLARVSERSDGSLMLVAHQPDLAEFISWLVADGVAEIAFPPGSIASLVLGTSTAAGGAGLQWLVTPALVATLHPEW
jgi:phosphohistidine phosphatase